jgi:2-keto-4-pentenoate hydratase/2-oxohepta-3-ene-1,7-dioic acid hydratase in catechol pathway
VRYCRFEHQGQSRYGRIESQAGIDKITLLLQNPALGQDGDQGHGAERIDPVALADATLLAPVQPTKIVCVGRNYRAHAAEMGSEVPREPLLFFKPPSSLLAPGKNIVRPKASELIHYEGELAVIIARSCFRLPRGADVRPYIHGYTALNDITARDLQKKDSQWVRGKGFDTFCPVGPIVTDEIDPWKGVNVETRVNGKLHQHGSTRDLIFPLDVLIHYISNVMTLMPGDLIATGTPEGVGPVVAGDTVEIYVEGVGTLQNPVIDQVDLTEE